MNGDVVGPLVQGVDVLDELDLVRRGLGGQQRVVTDDLHLHRHRPPGHRPADPAQTDDAGTKWQTSPAEPNFTVRLRKPRRDNFLEKSISYSP